MNGPNMQKFKLLLEPKQKTNSKEKKKKINLQYLRIGNKSSAKYKNSGKLKLGNC